MLTFAPPLKSDQINDFQLLKSNRKPLEVFRNMAAEFAGAYHQFREDVSEWSDFEPKGRRKVTRQFMMA